MLDVVSDNVYLKVDHQNPKAIYILHLPIVGRINFIRLNKMQATVWMMYYCIHCAVEHQHCNIFSFILKPSSVKIQKSDIKILIL